MSGDGSGLTVKDCSEAGESADASDKFFMLGVPGAIPRNAARARDLGKVTSAAQRRLEGLVSQLNARLRACGAALVQESGAGASLAQFVATSPSGADEAEVGVSDAMNKQLRFSPEGLQTLFEESRSVLAFKLCVAW